MTGRTSYCIQKIQKEEFKVENLKLLYNTIPLCSDTVLNLKAWLVDRGMTIRLPGD